MKRWKKIILLCAALFILVPSTISLADDKEDIRSKPQIVKEGGIELKSQRYDSSHYELLAYVEDSWNPFSGEQIDKGMLSIANTLFGATKLLSYWIEAGIDKLYSIDVLNDVSDKVSNVSNNLWDNLKDNFGSILVTLAALQIFAYYVGQRNGSKAGKTALKLITVFVIATVWFGNSSYYLKAMNHLSNASQVQIIKAGTPFAATTISDGEELEGSVAILRNTFFDLTVYRPTLLMNYGTTDEKKILEKDKKRIENLISLKLTKEGYEEKNSIVQNEIEDLKNEAMTTTNTPYKIGMAFISILFVIFLGVPILVVALFNFFIQIAIIGLSVFLPVACIISMLPRFSDSAYKVFGNIFGMFCLKAFTGLVMLFIFLVTDITQAIFPLTSSVNYFLNVVTTSVGIILVIVKRDKILSFVTAGHVTTTDAGIPRQTYRTYKQKVEKPAMKAAQRTAAFTSGFASSASNFAVQKMKEIRKNRTPQKAGSTTNTSAPANGTSLAERRKAIRTKQEVASSKEVKEKLNSMSPINLKKFQENRSIKRTKMSPEAASSSKTNSPSDKTSEKEHQFTKVHPIASTTPRVKETAQSSQQETKQKASNLVRSQRLVSKEGHVTRLNRTPQQQTEKENHSDQPIQHVSSQSHVEGDLQERRAAQRTVYQPPTNEGEE
ncbi:CD3337/EF1877 family mobilome membrane protein [Priestia megaterium]|uniref:CD3337/EF1877 family mobilome membrane protein n=1 Tax=Priestia megaterium TaxID=1404 RepID=UPI003673165A